MKPRSSVSDMAVKLCLSQVSEVSLLCNVLVLPVPRPVPSSPGERESTSVAMPPLCCYVILHGYKKTWVSWETWDLLLLSLSLLLLSLSLSPSLSLSVTRGIFSTHLPFPHSSSFSLSSLALSLYLSVSLVLAVCFCSVFLFPLPLPILLSPLLSISLVFSEEFPVM